MEGLTLVGQNKSVLVVPLRGESTTVRLEDDIISRVYILKAKIGSKSV